MTVIPHNIKSGVMRMLRISALKEIFFTRLYDVTVVILSVNSSGEGKTTKAGREE
jgi:hypothetical protein